MRFRESRPRAGNCGALLSPGFAAAVKSVAREAERFLGVGGERPPVLRAELRPSSSVVDDVDVEVAGIA